MNDLSDDEVPRFLTLNEDEKLRVAVLAGSFLRNNRNDLEPPRKWEVIDDIREIVGTGDSELLREFVEYSMAHALSRIDGLVRIERRKAAYAAKEAKRLEKMLCVKPIPPEKVVRVKKSKSEKRAERIEKLLDVKNAQPAPPVDVLIGRWLK
jgi:hypothetical protein